MAEKKLHIVSFDIPFPPNYGGVIDVFYKIRALHSAGVGIVLHCFHDQRGPAKELGSLCEEVHFYPRLTGISRHLSHTPYIVSSRISESLRERLLQDEFPILFEGLHTCFLMGDPAFRRRKKVYRESNIEHHYYFQLFKSASTLRDRAFFLMESMKLRQYQRNLRYADLMLVVSREDERYLKKRFPGNDILYLPSFHRDDRISSLPGRGNYLLYQGNLSVQENIRAVRYIIHQIYDDTLPELVVAGLNPPLSLVREIERHPNMRLEANPDEERMAGLIRDAQVNLMVTMQATGLKLKLLHALFHGRHALVNPAMLAGTGLEPVCHIASTPQQFRDSVSSLFEKEFTAEEITRRELTVMENFSNKKNCKKLIDLLNL